MQGPGSDYRPDSYWPDRLRENFSLRGTGHLEYDESYNRWLYRAKANALHRCLTGISSGAKVLDIGSGVGWVVRELTEAGYLVEGCDIGAVVVARLQEEFPDTKFFVAELGADPIPRADGHYGGATMLDVAYHVTDDEEWLAGLREIARILAPGGRLVVSDGFGAIGWSPASHVRFRSLPQWRAAEAFGLRVVEVVPYFRWLSRSPRESWMRILPDGLRGGIEYGLEHVIPRRPHMRCAVLERSA